MAVHNDGHAAAKSIRSILEQRGVALEVILIDDASDEETRQVLADFAADERVRIIHNAGNLGLTRSLIRGVRAATSDYIARLDAGDLMCAGRLAKQTAVLDAEPDVGVVTSRCLVRVMSNGKVIDEHERRPPLKHEQVKRQLCYRNPISHVSVTFRRAVYDDVGGYDPALVTSQDYDLWIRMLHKSAVRTLDEVLTVVVYDTATSITHRRNRLQLVNGLRIRTRHIISRQLPLLPTAPLLVKGIGMLLLPSAANGWLRRTYRRLHR